MFRSYNLRVESLESAAGHGQDRLVLLWLPQPDSALQESVFGRWLVNHVRNPGVPIDCESMLWPWLIVPRVLHTSQAQSGHY